MIVNMSDQDWEKAGERNIQDLLRFGLVAAIALSKDSTFFDIGANRGDYIKVANKYCLSRNIHAFEPIPHMAEYLQTTHPKVKVHQVAVSNSNQVAKFNVSNLDELSGLELRNQTEFPSGTTFTSIETKVVSIDTYIRKVKNLDLIKIDVEGAEINVLKGMKSTLTKHRPFVFVEHGIHGAEYYGHGPKDLWDITECLNYKILTVDGQEIENLKTLIDSFFNWPIWNYLLVPNEG